MRFFFVSLFALCLVFTSTLRPQSKYPAPETSDPFTYRFFINKFNFPLNNAGVLAQINIPDDNPLVGGSGGKFDNIVALFSGGFALSGYSGNLLWSNGVMAAGLVEDYTPGPVGSSPSDSLNRIYVVPSSDPPFSASWQNWRGAVNSGARFFDGDNDGMYNPVDKNNNNIWDPNEDRPDLLGDLTAWCVFNDGVPQNLRRFSVPPQGIEIRQILFASRWGNDPAFHNTLFVRYSIVNKNAQVPVMDSVFFGMYGDPDLGDHPDDLFGMDSLHQSSFTYNQGPDALFGPDPPALFSKIVQGPVSYIPGISFTDINQNGSYDEGIDIPLDSAYNHLGPFLGIKVFPGAKNLSVSSGSSAFGGDPYYHEPDNVLQARYFLRGRLGNGLLPNPCSFPYGTVAGGVPCTNITPDFHFSGDPVQQIGWLAQYPGDIKSVISIGPFKLEYNKPVDILTAYIGGRGTSPLNSVSVARTYSSVIDNSYSRNFSDLPTAIVDNLHRNINFQLYQNYPNPFNPSTTISYNINSRSYVTLKLFDLLGNEVALLVNGEKDEGNYSFNLDVSGFQLSSGIYFYRLQAGDFIQTKKMILLK